jgi:uncharacterized membrane protein (UPF0136 family)
MTKKTASIVLSYGIAMVLLGIVGYLEKKSRMSLIAGGSLGLLLIGCARAMFSHQRWGLYAASALVLILTATFAVRYSLTQNPLMAMLGTLSGSLLLFLCRDSLRARRDTERDV